MSLTAFKAGSRSALITGAATRIGAATARDLHADGYNIAVHFRSSTAKAQDLVADLNATRPNSAVALQADLGKWNASSPLPKIAEELISNVVATFGDLHVLINNASTFARTPLLLSEGSETTAIEEEEEVFTSNALAPFYLTRSFARYAQRNNANQKARFVAGSDPTVCHQYAPPDRSVILFGDALVRTSPHRRYSLYSMAKMGAESLTQSASAELALEGIRINCIRPGFNVFPSNMIEEERKRLRALVPLKGGIEGTPADISNAIRFLVDPSRAGYISGAMLDIDGGLRHIAKS